MEQGLQGRDQAPEGGLAGAEEDPARIRIRGYPVREPAGMLFRVNRTPSEPEEGPEAVRARVVVKARAAVEAAGEINFNSQIISGGELCQVVIEQVLQEWAP